ncbi:MAG: ribulose-phosphate 3-epimerase [Bacteroidales bacterium]|jgi:ribulose-phosphate 3-epimerase|nr:ribulose-phosphate 3-epimerase [Bacteroidales bacterium]
MSLIIAPSILSADFAHLSDDIRMVNESQADWFHLDIMDGLFVPNISYGFPVVKAIASLAEKPLDAHLMIMNPDRYIDRFAEVGVSWLSVHYEACTHLHRTFQHIKNAGMKAGVAINPHTPVSCLEEIIPYCDYILVMAVNPGFGGQSFIPTTVSKVAKLHAIIAKVNPDCIIEVDGGVNDNNISSLAAAGARAFVAGNSVFTAEDPSAMISKLRNQSL